MLNCADVGRRPVAGENAINQVATSIVEPLASVNAVHAVLGAGRGRDNTRLLTCGQPSAETSRYAANLALIVGLSCCV